MTLTYDNLAGENPVTIDTFRNESILALSAAGVPHDQIAESVGVSIERVTVFLQSDKSRFRVGELREKLFGNDPSARAKISAVAAWKVIDDLMDSVATKDAIKLAAAKEILDRAHGKAAQHVEMGGSLLRTLIERLDRRAIAPGVDRPERAIIEMPAIPSPLAPAPAKLSPPPSQMDTVIDGWVEKNF